jgi:O-antigen ligase
MIIGVPFSYYRSASLMDVFNYASINTMFFFLFYKLVNTIAKLRSLLFAYCSGVAIYAIYILKFGNFSDSRISFGTMFDPNDIAFYIISFLTFNLLFITKDNKGYKRIISIINIMIGLIVILKTGSRGGLIALITVFAYLLFAKTRTVKLSFMTKGALVLIAIVSLLFVNMNSDRYKTILDLQNDYNVTDETGRIAIWKIGTRLMLSHPFTGIGMNRFSEGVGRDREERGFHAAEWQAPHNSLVQIGAETGIFGLILFCLMSSNAFKITGQIIGKSRSEELVKISEMARAGFIGLFLSAMFISQAYSVYWVFYIVLSAVMKYMLDNEAKSMQNNYG